MRNIIILTFALLCAGCVHSARTFAPPDPAAMRDHTRKLAAAVAEARTHVQEAGKALAGSEKSQAAARALFDIVLPKIDALPLDSPADIKLAVASIQEDMSSLRELLDDDRGDTVTARTEMTAAGVKLEEANAEKNLAQAAADKYIAEATKQAADRTADDAKWAKDSKALAWYRLHWWGAWIVLGAGVVGCIALAFLKATGRLAIGAARIAA